MLCYYNYAVDLELFLLRLPLPLALPLALVRLRIAENGLLLRFWMLKSTICKTTHRAWDLFLQVRIIRFVVFVHLRI